MKKETKDEVKNNVATGFSTAAGSTVGVVIGTAITPSDVEAAEVVSITEEAAQPKPEPMPAQKPTSEAEPSQTPSPARTHSEESSHTSHIENSTSTGTQDPSGGVDPNEVEVISYDRETNENGNQVDIAVLNVRGNEIGVIDLNLDGEADIIACDRNNNGIIEEDEYEDVQGQGIAMQPLADAAGFNPQFAQNELPDYVNDADVDTYMA